MNKNEMSTAAVDERSKELIEEFTQHYRDFVQQYPGQNDRDLIFEGWAIQKIAGLQVVVQELAKELNLILE